MAAIDREQLDRAHQVDYTLLEHELASRLWTLEELQPWAWDPLTYTQLAGGTLFLGVTSLKAPHSFVAAH